MLAQSPVMARLTIRIDIGESAAFGPGKARLLELIDATGSIRQAAVAMNMSYRRAWLLLRETEAMMKVPAVTAQTGGRKGGGTALTPTGRALVECYRVIETQAEQSVLTQLNEIVRMTNSAPTAFALGRKVTRHKSR